MKNDQVGRDFLDKLRNLRVFEKGGQRAVHKPLLVLLALAKLKGGLPRLLPFREVEPALQRLIKQFGTTGNARHARAHYPFWYLRNDGFWNFPDAESLGVRKGKPEPKVSALRNANAVAGFSEPVFTAMRLSPGLVQDAAMIVLQEAFPPTLHEDVLNAVGLDVDVTVRHTRRDAKFREQVLRAYAYSCAVCSYDGRVLDQVVAIEAAHIKWVQAGGSNSVTNGIALCSLHHKLFDTGAFTVSENGVLQVSDAFIGNSTAVRHLIGCNGGVIQRPIHKTAWPDPANLEWHWSEVFKGDCVPPDVADALNIESVAP